MVLRHTPGTPGTGFTSLLLTGGGCRMGLGARVRHTGSPAAHSRIPVIPGGRGGGTGVVMRGGVMRSHALIVGWMLQKVEDRVFPLPTQENHFRRKPSKPKGKGLHTHQFIRGVELMRLVGGAMRLVGGASWAGSYLPRLGGQGQCHSSSSPGALEPCGDQKRLQMDWPPTQPWLAFTSGPLLTHPSPLPLRHLDEPPGNPFPS